MDGAEQHTQEDHRGWEEIGRAAEDFARRVARDAVKFATRLEGHATDFAHDVSRDWRRAQRHHSYRHACHAAEPGDVRRIFDDIRGVLADVLDGVDELIERVFPGTPDAASDEWITIVNNRDATCGGCGRTLGVGNEVHARRTAAGFELRCLDCKPPNA